MGTINLNAIVKAALNKFDEDELVDAWNMYLESIDDEFRQIYTAEYGIDDALEGYSLYEKALKIKENCFDPYKKYFYINDDDDMVSFRSINDEESPFDIDELAYWFILNKGNIDGCEIILSDEFLFKVFSEEYLYDITTYSFEKIREKLNKFSKKNGCGEVASPYNFDFYGMVEDYIKEESEGYEDYYNELREKFLK